MKQEATLSPAILVPVMYVTRGDVTQQQTNKTKISFASAWMWRTGGGSPGEQEAGGVRETGEERAGSGREIQKGKHSLFITAYHPVKNTKPATYFDSPKYQQKT